MDKIWISIERDGKTVLSLIKEYDHITYNFTETVHNEQDFEGKVRMDEGIFKAEGRTTKKSTDVPEGRDGN